MTASPRGPMAPNAQEVALTPELQCLGGKKMNLEVVKDLKRLSLLPEDALTRLWEVLGPLLGGELSRERLDRVLTPFCEAHRADHDDLLRGLAATRVLIRSAAEQNLDVEKFVEDLELLDVDVLTARAICSGYDHGVIVVRGELMMASLLDHGRVLTKVDWRIDQMRGSNRGKDLDAPVASLTFNYQVGDQSDRMTLQILPPVLRQLRETLDELLADPGPPKAK